MSKQDRQGVRKATDIEQKYGLGQFMYRQNKSNQDMSKGISNLGESLSSYKEESNNQLSQMNESIESVSKELESLTKAIFGMVYPVGAIYISVSATNPSKLFGGTWEQIQNRFLLAAGSSYSAGATGGEAAHTLTAPEMPSHYHRENFYYAEDTVRPFTSRKIDSPYTETTEQISGGYKYLRDSYDYGTASASTPVYPIITSSTGGGAAHNNMPPYLAVYVWKRTA